MLEQSQRRGASPPPKKLGTAYHRLRYKIKRVLNRDSPDHRELHRSGDEAAWWQKLKIDPLPVALRLWQHTRLNGDGLAPSENMTSSQVAQKRDTSVRDPADTNDEARANVEGAVSNDGDPLTSR